MFFDFKNQNVSVTGRSKGIARAVALDFARSGAAVSIRAWGAAALQATATEIAARSVPVHHAVCDLADGAAVHAS